MPTVKKLICLLGIVLLALMILPAAGEEEYRVFFEEETEPFGEEEELLTLQVAGKYGGDCMLLTCGGESLLVDTGDSGTASFFPQFEEMMESAGLGKHVDALFNSHPHRDHLNGLQEMLEGGYTFGRIYTAFPHDFQDGTPSVVQQKMIRSAEEYAIPVVDVKNGDVIPFGKAEMTVIRLPDEMIRRDTLTNDQSAMIRIRYGNCSLLLTGDCEVYAQSRLNSLYELKSDIMKAPHHGLGWQDPHFLQDVDPEFVFITNGSSDTQKVVNTMQKFGYKRYMFASWGKITLRCNGEKWIVRQDPNPGMENHANNVLKTMLRP